MKEIFSSGGGTQSNAIVVLVIQGKIPKPDLVVIADTGREMPTTWDYMEKYTKPGLAEIGVPMVRISQEYCSNAAKEIFHQSGSLLIPAFSTINGNASKLPNFCTNEWKVRVCHRWITENLGIKRRDYRKWIGFSFDEKNRVLKMQKGQEWKDGLIRFPLVHDVPTKRRNAIKIVIEHGWPRPPRSRCWLCPNQTDLEWSEVQNDFPELFSEAVRIDEEIRTQDEHAFMHSSMLPLKEVDLSQKDDLFSGSCPSGECFL